MGEERKTLLMTVAGCSSVWVRAWAARKQQEGKKNVDEWRPPLLALVASRSL